MDRPPLDGSCSAIPSLRSFPKAGQSSLPSVALMTAHAARPLGEFQFVDRFVGDRRRHERAAAQFIRDDRERPGERSRESRWPTPDDQQRFRRNAPPAIPALWRWPERWSIIFATPRPTGRGCRCRLLKRCKPRGLRWGNCAAPSPAGAPSTASAQAPRWAQPMRFRFLIRPLSWP